eukprot:TRINITY_DN10509_c0_g1_i1.p1 TRINITY_DN10509_c0_g1~~TRINITY_DN10509_c0_g1_i1.p1  ORF type:complete len:295 (-),score=64.68 TRINITY_DN10509_c0_g1_i1:177-1028(-)
MDESSNLVKEKKIVETPIEHENDDDEHVVETGNTVGKTSPLSVILGFACFPFTLCCSWFTVKEQHEAVILNYGKFTGISRTPGLHFRNCFGREVRMISKQKKTIHLPVTKIVDRSGNPLNVSAIVVFYNEDSKKCAIDVQNSTLFTLNAAQTVIKTAVGNYPYESHKKNQWSLKTHAAEIGKEMAKLLQDEVNVAGVRIVSFQFNELSYAPEIASGMLKRQQAQAMVAAREKIVEGAMSIALSAVSELEKNGFTLKPDEKSRIVTNLLTIICSDQDAKPSINV